MASLLEGIEKGPKISPPRILLLGEAKVGKSTFAAGSPAPIFLPMEGEEGVDEIGVDRFPVAKDWAAVSSALYALATEPHEYKTAVIDSASTLERLIWEDVCERNGCTNIEDPGYGKGYALALSWWNILTRALDCLRAKGMATIIIGHVRVKTVNDPLTDAYDSYRFDIQEKAAEVLTRWSDCILFAGRPVVLKSAKTKNGAEVKTDSKGKGKALPSTAPLLFTRNHPGRPGGGRGAYGELPPEIPLDWDSFQAAVDAVRSKKRKGE